MTAKRWMVWLSTWVAGVCLLLGAASATATAEPDANTGGTSSSDASASRGSVTDATSEAGGDAKSSDTETDSGGEATPEAKVDASSVRIRDDATDAGSSTEPTPVADPVLPTEDTLPVEPTPTAEPAKPGRDSATQTVAPRAKVVVTDTAEPTREPEPTVREKPAEAQTSPPVADPADAPVEPAAAPTLDVPRVAGAALIAAVPVAKAAPQPTLIDVVGTLLFTLVTLPLRLFEQEPVIPPGSTVTVGRATLAIGCGCGQAVDARWYFPNQAEPPRSIVYLQHGFFRSNSAMSALAIHTAEQTNSIVVAPTLSSNPFASDDCWINGQPMQRAVADLFTGDRSALADSAAGAGWTGGALPTKFVLSGHSAGGGLATAAAGYTVDNGAIGDLLLVVMLDGVPTGDALPVALAKLSGTNHRDVFQIAAPPYAWNSFGSGVAQLQQARPGEFVGVRLDGGSHVDAEGASTDILASIACGFSRPQNVAALQAIAAGWIDDAIDGTRDGVYGQPGEALSVETAAGRATGVALGSAATVSISA